MCTTCAPSRLSPLITRYTAFSLPGIKELASTTVSPRFKVTTGCSRLAIRDSADSGSPWEPVEMITTSSGRKLSMSRSSIKVLAGTLR